MAAYTCLMNGSGQEGTCNKQWILQGFYTMKS